MTQASPASRGCFVRVLERAAVAQRFVGCRQAPKPAAAPAPPPAATPAATVKAIVETDACPSVALAAALGKPELYVATMYGEAEAVARLLAAVCDAISLLLQTPQIRPQITPIAHRVADDGPCFFTGF